MRNLPASLFLLLALFFSCGEKAERASLTDEQISRIMADMFIADAATTGLAGYPKDSLMHVYFAQVLEMHHVTAEEYEKNLALLAKDLDRMGAVTRAASDLLNTEKKEDNKAK